MNHNSHLKRAHRHWYEDGIGEILAGVSIILIGLFFLAENILALDTNLGKTILLALAVLLIGGQLALRPTITRIKERVSYPRTGYVQVKPAQRPKKQSVLRFILVILGMIPVSIIVGLVIGKVTELGLPIGYLFLGLVVGYGLFDLGRNLDITRFKLLGLWTVFVGTGITVSQIGQQENMVGLAVLFILPGTAAVVLGVVILYRFLRQHTPVNLEEAP